MGPPMEVSQAIGQQDGVQTCDGKLAASFALNPHSS